MLHCDINCDTGEGMGNEAAVMPFITSANIACGFHAGDEETMKKVVDLCMRHGVAIGAHPSYPDRENFGRKDLIGSALRPKDVFDIVTQQIHVLQKIATEQGAVLHHVKPHGALYNRAAYDSEVGHFICLAMQQLNPALKLYGLSGSRLKQQADTFGLAYVHEVFADRTYQDDGSLTPRTEPNALIEDEAAAIKQVLQIVHEGQVTTVSGKKIYIQAQTICIHGDGDQAVAIAKKLYEHLKMD